MDERNWVSRLNDHSNPKRPRMSLTSEIAFGREGQRRHINDHLNFAVANEIGRIMTRTMEYMRRGTFPSKNFTNLILKMKEE